MSTLVLPINLSNCSFDCIRTIGYLTHYDWRNELATFNYKGTIFQIQTTIFGPFPFTVPTLLHIFAKRESSFALCKWQGFQFISADGLNLALFEQYINLKQQLSDQTC